jgi:hypothetical protein
VGSKAAYLQPQLNSAIHMKCRWAAQPKVWACGLSFAEIVVSNPAGVMEVCLLIMLSIVR